jgi:hypothetical protein
MGAQRRPGLDLLPEKAVGEAVQHRLAARQAGLLPEFAQEFSPDMEAAHPAGLARPLRRADIDLIAHAEQRRHADARRRDRMAIDEARMLSGEQDADEEARPVGAHHPLVVEIFEIAAGEMKGGRIGSIQ